MHLDYFSDKYNVFPSWDAFINHEDIPNCYYDKKYEIKNKKVYGILRTSKDIKKGEELILIIKMNITFILLFGIYYESIYSFQIFVI